MSADQQMRQYLLSLLQERNAHLSLDDAVADFPEAAMNQKPPNVPYSPWHLLEHIRIAQRDILDFIRDPAHVSPDWPEGYWPDREAQADPARWQQTLADIRADMAALADLITDPETELLAPIPHVPDYTIFREIIVVADHNAYHLGEFAILRQVMQTWPAGRDGRRL